tara:strand:+ start:1331 stop:1954 length:624 start_codon:yes stop_codon:yes gene_type:complete
MNDKIGVIDIGIGNVGSIFNMLKKISCNGIRVNSFEDLSNIERLIIPGVGSFDEGVKKLDQIFSINRLRNYILEKRCITLGICLGMQLLGNKSEEGKLEGLNLIEGNCKRFELPKKSNLKIPNMGWNEVIPKENSKLFNDNKDLRFYFTHSYHFVCDDINNESATALFSEFYTASIEKDHIFGVQFHPEKSHKFGMNLLKNFTELKL